MDEKELLRAQIKAYTFYAGLIDRAVGGGALAKLPRWDEQRAAEYRELAEQLQRRLAELEAEEAEEKGAPSNGATGGSGATETADTQSPAVSAPATDASASTHG